MTARKDLKKKHEEVYKNALQLSVYSEGQLQRNNFEDFFQNVLKKRFYRVLIGVKG